MKNNQWFERALQDLSRQNYQRAAFDLRRASLLEPEDYRYYVNQLMARSKANLPIGLAKWYGPIKCLASDSFLVIRNLLLLAEKEKHSRFLDRLAVRALILNPDYGPAIEVLLNSREKKASKRRLSVLLGAAYSSGEQTSEILGFRVDQLLLEEKPDRALRLVESKIGTYEDLRPKYINCLYRLGRVAEARQLVLNRLATGHSTIEEIYAAIAEERGCQDFARVEQFARIGLTLSPDDAHIYGLLCRTHAQGGASKRVIKPARRAEIINPKSKLHLAMTKGAALLANENYPKAARAFKAATVNDPGSAVAYSNLGALRTKVAQMREGEVFLRRALMVQEDLAEAYGNLAIVCRFQNRLNDGLHYTELAMQQDPNEPMFRFTKALINLSDGDAGQGARDYDTRWDVDSFATPRKMRPTPSLNLPVWDGGQGDNIDLAIWGEQGVGDELWYSSYLPFALERVKSCTFECTPHLLELFTRSFPGIEVQPRPQDPLTNTFPGASHQVPIGNIFTLAAGEGKRYPGGHLKPAPELIEAYRKRFRSNSPKLVVGISWMSNKGSKSRSFSMPLSNWSSIFGLPDIQFVDLQYGDTSQERALAKDRFDVEIYRDETIDHFKDLHSVAAQVAAVDLVVSVANSTVPLAYGVNVPAAVALRTTQEDWRFSRLNEHQRWMSNATAFWQKRPYHWDGVLDRVSGWIQQNYL